MSGIANDRILRDGMRGLCLSLNAVASWLPSQLDNLALWMRADEGAATSGSRGFASASSRHFSIADNASLSLGGDIEFAIAVWVYFDTLSGTVGLVSKDATGGQRGIDLRWITGTGLQFAVSTDGSTIQAVTSSETLTTGQWYLICGWRESQTLYVSVNNGTPDSVAHSTTFDNNAAFVLGARLGGSSGFLDGRLSRFGFRKGSAWSASERTELFNNGNALTHGALSSALKTDLVSYLNLNEASGNAIDAHGSNDFTAVNAPTAAAGPAVMTAADSSGNENNGDLVGFGGSEATAWKSDTPHGSQQPTAFDSSGNNNHGRLIGTGDNPRSTDVPAELGGGNSMAFDGSDDKVRHSLVSFAAGEPATVSVWFKADAISSKVLCGRHDNGSNYIQLLGATVRVRFNGPQLNFAFSQLAPDVWHHLAVVKTNSGTARAYLDGVESTTGELSSASQISFNTIGEYSSAGFEYGGKVDDYRIYDEAHSAAQIAELAAGDEPTGASTPQLHLTFDESNTRDLPVMGAGRSLEFDGVDDYTMVSDDASLNITTTVSVRAFVKPTDVVGTQTIIIKGVTAGSAYAYGLRTSGAKVQYLWASSGANILESDANLLVAGEWSEITVTHTSGAEPTMYVNGVPVAATMSLGVATRPLTTTTEPLGIGAEGSGVNPMAGLIDDPQIYDAILTAAEILSLYTEGARGTDPTDTNLQGHWKFDDGPQSVNTITDGDPVTQWQSKEGNRRVFSQGTTAKRPTYVAEAINGQPAIDFDGTDDLLVAAEAFLTGDRGVVAFVIKPSGLGSNEWVLSSADEGSANDHLRLGVRSTDQVFIDHKDAGTTDGVRGSTALSAGNTYIVLLQSSGSLWTMRLDGSDESLSGTGGVNAGKWWDDANNLDSVVLGALKNTTESEFFEGYIAEVIVYSDVLTAEEIGQIESYLASRYGVTLS